MAKRGRPKKLVYDNGMPVEPKVLPPFPEEALKPAFSLRLEVNNTMYQCYGNTILEALNAIPLDYVQVKTKGTIIVTEGERKASKFYNLFQLRKVFANKSWKIIQANYLNKLLK